MVFWIVGCLAGQNATAASFAEVSVFEKILTIIRITIQVNVMMDTLADLSNFCRPFLVSRQRDCLEDADGPGFTIVEATNATAQLTSTTLRDCSLACRNQPSCEAWSWDESGGNCQLYTDGQLSGYLDGQTSYAGTCL